MAQQLGVRPVDHADEPLQPGLEQTAAKGLVLAGAKIQ